MSSLNNLSNKQVVDALFKEIPLKYRKYKAGFIKESWITGKYLVRNTQDFMTQEALLELSVDSKLAQIAIKFHLQELIDSSVIKKKKTPTSTPKKATRKAERAPTARKPKMSSRKMETNYGEESKEQEMEEEEMENMEETEARKHAKVLIAYVKTNLNSDGYVLGSSINKHSRTLKFDYKKQGFKRYGMFLYSIDEFRNVKTGTGSRIYLTEDFEKMPAVQDLSRAVGKIFGSKSILKFDDFEERLMKDNAFSQIQDLLPMQEPKQAVSFMPQYQIFGYNRTQMIQNVNGRLRVTFTNMDKSANVKIMQEFLKNDDFQPGRISFRRGGICSVQLTPPRDCFRAVRMYNGKVLKGISMEEVECTMPDIFTTDRKSMVETKKEAEVVEKKAKRTKTEKKRVARAEEGLKMTDNNEITIEPDTSRMLFMNKIPKNCTPEEVIEELQLQDLIVQNEIIIRRGYINPVILETEEQCQRALEEDVMVNGVILNVEKVKPRPPLENETNPKNQQMMKESGKNKNARNVVEVIEHEDMGLEKRQARNKSNKNQNKDKKVAQMMEEEEEEYMMEEEEEYMMEEEEEYSMEEEEEMMANMEEDEEEEMKDEEEKEDEEDMYEEEMQDGMIIFELNERVEAFYDDMWAMATVEDCDEDHENYDVLFEENHIRLLLPSHCLRKLHDSSGTEI